MIWPWLGQNVLVNSSDEMFQRSGIRSYILHLLFSKTWKYKNVTYLIFKVQKLRQNVTYYLLLDRAFQEPEEDQGKLKKFKKKLIFLISQNFDFSDAMQVRLELLIKMCTFSKLGLTNSWWSMLFNYCHLCVVWNYLNFVLLKRHFLFVWLLTTTPGTLVSWE